MENIYTRDLYIVKIRIVKKVWKNSYFACAIEEDGCYYIAARKTEYGFIDIFTNKCYKTFNMLSDNEMNSGVEVSVKAKSVLSFMKNKNFKISKEELIKILNSKNRDNKKCILNMDLFLNTLLITHSKIMASKLPVLIKNKYILRLRELADEYTSMMISLKSGKLKDGNNQIDELKIKERFFRKLIELENELCANNDIEVDEYSILKDKISKILKNGGKEL